MANTSDRATALKNIEEGIAELVAADHSESEFASRAGIPLSTFRRNRRRPEGLTVGHLLDIAETGGVKPSALFEGKGGRA